MKLFLHQTLSITTLFSIGTSLLAVAETPGSGYFSDWPAGASPAEVGKRVAENILPRKFRYETNPEKAALGVIYPEVIAWYGALTVAKLTNDTDLSERLVKKFEPFLSEPGSARINRKAHVDYRVLGAVPLEIYMENKDPRCKELGLSLADAQWENHHAGRHHRGGALLDR